MAVKVVSLLMAAAIVAPVVTPVLETVILSVFVVASKAAWAAPWVIELLSTKLIWMPLALAPEPVGAVTVSVPVSAKVSVPLAVYRWPNRHSPWR